MTIRKLIYLSVILGCGPGSSRFNIHWNNHKEIPGVREAIQVARDMAPCRIEDSLWSGNVYWLDYPFMCGGRLVKGCQNPPGMPIFHIGWQDKHIADTALLDEIGHYIFQLCGKGDGEYIENSKVVYTEEFSNWLGDVRETVRRLDLTEGRSHPEQLDQYR